MVSLFPPAYTLCFLPAPSLAVLRRYFSLLIINIHTKKCCQDSCCLIRFCSGVLEEKYLLFLSKPETVGGRGTMIILQLYKCVKPNCTRATGNCYNYSICDTTCTQPDTTCATRFVPVPLHVCLYYSHTMSTFFMMSFSYCRSL